MAKPVARQAAQEEEAAKARADAAAKAQAEAAAVAMAKGALLVTPLRVAAPGPRSPRQKKPAVTSRGWRGKTTSSS